jgi:tripartite-type tricarboxylate transporter receptor subunit TctC
MKTFIRAAQVLVLAAAALLVMPSHATDTAAAYPSRPVRMVVTFPPGGGADIIARIIGQELGKRLGQSVIIDNRAGANGNVGMENAAHAAPDGYTMVITTVGTWAVNPSLYKASFDVFKDFAPVIQVTSSPGVLCVAPSSPLKSVADLIALAKSEPGKLNYSSAGIGGFGHVSAVMFELMAGVKMTHVPYKGASPANVALMSGEVQLSFNDAIAALPYLKAGTLRALAVTSLRPTPIFPGLPTINESGLKGYDNAPWMAIAVPAGTPPAIIAKLNQEINAVLETPSVRDKIMASGAEVVGGTPEHFAQLLKSEVAKFAKIVGEGHIVAN